MEEVYAKIYRSEIPLPENPLKALNSYIIRGETKTVIIDTGFNRPESKTVFYANLEEMGVEIAGADVVITHLHADHSGLAQELAEQGARILMSRGDGEAAQRMRGGSGQSSQHRWQQYGFPPGEDLMSSHPGRIYAPASGFPFTVLAEGDEIVVDDYRFRVVSVPGHTPDMINLYEPTHGLYFSADHVLDPITPNITYWGPEHPVILRQYLQSLQKIYPYRISLMLPAHRHLITDHQKRIDELLAHHAHRMQEIEIILARHGTELTVVEIAREMSWKIRAKDWDDFPTAQKIFATGEAMSHLDYLVAEGRVKRRDTDEVWYFSRPQ